MCHRHLTSPGHKYIFLFLFLFRCKCSIPVQTRNASCTNGTRARRFLLADTGFLKGLLLFSATEKDKINEETIELLAPYTELEDFTPGCARNASKAAEGLCTWVRAMGMYHEASKIVKPKLEALNIAAGRLAHAERELQKAVDKLARCKATLDRLQVRAWWCACAVGASWCTRASSRAYVLLWD